MYFVCTIYSRTYRDANNKSIFKEWEYVIMDRHMKRVLATDCEYTTDNQQSELHFKLTPILRALRWCKNRFPSYLVVVYTNSRIAFECATVLVRKWKQRGWDINNRKVLECRETLEEIARLTTQGNVQVRHDDSISLGVEKN